MITAIFFDFNQVLKKSVASEDFVPITQLVDVRLITSSHRQLLLTSSLYINKMLITWASEYQTTIQFFIWSASNPALLQLIKELFSPLFTDIISTQVSQLYKNEADSYKQVTKLFNLQSDHCLLVDDQLENVETALAAKWQAIHFHNNSTCLSQLDTIWR